jgi:hypothetical protein
LTNKALEHLIKSKSTIKNTKNRRSFIVHIPKYKHAMHQWTINYISCRN